MATYKSFYKLVWQKTITCNHPGCKQQTSAPKIFKPASGNISKNIIEKFLAHQQQLASYFEKLDVITRHKKIIINSPVSSFITLNLRTAIRVIVQHEQRHINQANSVLNHPQFPKF